MLVRAGLEQTTVMVHASLRRFGKVEGGAEAMIDILTEVCRNVMMPGFQCYGNCQPPDPSWLVNNGYGSMELYDPAQVAPYLAEKVPMVPSMGILAERFAARKETQRGNHPWNSWLAWGREAYFLVGQKDWQRPNLPIEKSLSLDARVLLLGVGFDKCTALHLAEEQCGKIWFTRWTQTEEGLRPMRINGCGQGFWKTAAWLPPGPVWPVKLILEKAREEISKNKFCFICNPNCLKCKNSVYGK
jgi:aminoglycoside 3-N-acetyltransferase